MNLANCSSPENIHISSESSMHGYLLKFDIANVSHWDGFNIMVYI